MREPDSAGQVDVVTGAVRISVTDVALPGVLPLMLRRTHLSTYRMGGAFGPSWASTLDLRIEIDSGGARLIAEDGSVISYPPLAEAGSVYPLAGRRWPLEGDVTDGLRVTDPATGVTWHFAQPPDPNQPGPSPVKPSQPGSSQPGSSQPGSSQLGSSQPGSSQAEHSHGRHSQPEPEVRAVEPETRAVEPETMAVEPKARAVEPKAAPDLDGELVLPIAAITHRCGDRIDVVVDAAGRVRDLVHSCGYRIAVTWDTDRVTGLGLRSASGTAVTRLAGFEYTAAGPGGRQLTEVVDRAGLPLRYSYDRLGRMTRWTDRAQRWYAFDYDPNGRCVGTTGTGGYLASTWEYEESGDGGVTTVVDAMGNSTRYELDAFGNIVRVVDAGDGVRLLEWDDDGRLTSATDQTGATTRYGYDQRGNLIETRCADGTRESVTYDDQDRPITVTDAGGGTTSIGYDGRGNIVRIVAPTGASTTFDYDEAGHVRGSTDPLGAVTTVRCDPAGLPVEVVDPVGARVAYHRDDTGRIVRIVERSGGAEPATTTVTYTDSGLPASRTFPDGAVETMAYDPCGNLVEHKAVTGAVTRYEYIAFDRLSARILPDGERIGYEYDARLYPVKVTNPDGASWTYRYDACGYLTGETDFDGRELGYANDLAGRLIARTDGLHRTTYYVRDAAGRVVTRQAPEGHTGYTYDQMGRLIRARSDTVDLTRSYDRVGHLVAETVDGRTIQFGYDALGRRSSRTTPTGLVSTVTYRTGGSPKSLTVGRPAEAGPDGPAGAGGRTVTFAVDGAGRPFERQLATDNGWLCLRYTNDEAGRLIAQTLMSVTATIAPAEPIALGLRAGRRFPGAPRARHECRVLAHHGYTYRPDGLPSSTTDHRDGRRTVEFDALGRILSVVGSGWAERYTYRACGAPATATWPATVPGDLTVDSQRGEREYRSSRLIRAGMYHYDYDGNGRVVRQFRQQPSGTPLTWRYAWDSDDRLTGVQTCDGTRWSYRYDPLGRRLGKYRHSPDGRVVEQIDFTWDGDCLAEQAHYRLENPDGPTVTTWDHLPGCNTPVTQTERRWLAGTGQPTIDQRTYLVVTDPAGIVTELADAVDGVVWRVRTTVWGAQVTRDSSGADCPLRLPRQYRDAETGNVYDNQRYFDPAAARYLSQDPFGLVSSMDPSGYPADQAGAGCDRLVRPGAASGVGSSGAGSLGVGPSGVGSSGAVAFVAAGAGGVGPTADLCRMASMAWPVGALLPAVAAEDAVAAAEAVAAIPVPAQRSPSGPWLLSGPWTSFGSGAGQRGASGVAGGLVTIYDLVRDQ